MPLKKSWAIQVKEVVERPRVEQITPHHMQGAYDSLAKEGYNPHHGAPLAPLDTRQKSLDQSSKPNGVACVVYLGER